jgi:hypothetical protein
MYNIRNSMGLSDIVLKLKRPVSTFLDAKIGYIYKTTIKKCYYLNMSRISSYKNERGWGGEERALSANMCVHRYRSRQFPVSHRRQICVYIDIVPVSFPFHTADKYVCI